MHVNRHTHTFTQSFPCVMYSGPKQSRPVLVHAFGLITLVVDHVAIGLTLSGPL